MNFFKMQFGAEPSHNNYTKIILNYLKVLFRMIKGGGHFEAYKGYIHISKLSSVFVRGYRTVII